MILRRVGSPGHAAGIAGVCVAAVAVGFRLSLGRVRVTGISMSPTYVDGELIWMLRHRRLSTPHVGDVIVFRAPPNIGLPTLIKRVTAVGGQISPVDGCRVPDKHVAVAGDNPLSLDSR